MRLEEILQKINTFTYFARKCLLVAVEIIQWNNCANISKILYYDLKIKEYEIMSDNDYTMVLEARTFFTIVE